MLRNFLQRLTGEPSDLGAAAERFAASWLQQKRGFTIVASNWRNPRDRREEIDLVCRDGEVLVFVEVKARSATARVAGYYAVNQRKKNALLGACRSYLARLNPQPITYRFDVVEVSVPEVPPPGIVVEPQVLHFENVALFPKRFLR